MKIRRRSKRNSHGGERAGAGRPLAGRVPYRLRLKAATVALIERLCFQRSLSRGEIVEEKFSG